MKTKTEITDIVQNVLNQNLEGITDFSLQDVIKQTKDYLVVKVGYTWSLHGWKKEVNNIECILYKENGIWRKLI